MTIATHKTELHKHAHKHENITNNTYQFHTHIYEHKSLKERFKEVIKKWREK